jgi:hypothetical protein
MAHHRTVIPEFTQPTRGEALENSKDAAEIIEDQDQTTPTDNLTADENMGAKTFTLDSLENEPAEFSRGDIDVKTQMDRTARRMNSAIHGFESLDDEPQAEGGLEEVVEKTEQALARRRHRH